MQNEPAGQRGKDAFKAHNKACERGVNVRLTEDLERIGNAA